jgi:transcription elongation GreA/GreB family factor
VVLELVTMPYHVSKESLKKELVRAVAAQLDTLERTHRATLEGATHEEAKPENDKDTRALEQSYVARGQALRLDELQRQLAELSAMPIRAFQVGAPAARGALVTVEENDKRLHFFVALHGGGTALDGGKVQVVTPMSPLGRALLGKVVGDACEAQAGGRARLLDVVEVV